MLAGSAPAARAGNASWAHQAGSLSSNGAVTVKSLAGGSTAAMQNPTGAIAKASQNAATQPPTVIIQATSSGAVFSYKDDCYELRINSPSYGTYSYRGIGKISAGTFTGIVARPTGYADSYLISASLSAASPGATGSSSYGHVSFVTVGDTDALGFYLQNLSGNSYNAALVTSMAYVSATKCYP